MIFTTRSARIELITPLQIEKMKKTIDYRGLRVGMMTDNKTLIGYRLRDHKLVFMRKCYYDTPVTIYDYEKIVDEIFRKREPMV